MHPKLIGIKMLLSANLQYSLLQWNEHCEKQLWVSCKAGLVWFAQLTVLGHIKEKRTNYCNNDVCSHLLEVKAGSGIASPTLLGSSLAVVLQISHVFVFVLLHLCLSLLLLGVE